MNGNGSIDLSVFDTKTQADQGIELEILHIKTGKPTGFRIRVLGEDSAVMQERVRAYREQVLESSRVAMRGTRTHEDIESEGIERLVIATVGWTEGATFFGEAFPFSRENARKLYTDPRIPEIREQVERGMAKRANFLPANGTGS
jgi:hypothetical protein